MAGRRTRLPAAVYGYHQSLSPVRCASQVCQVFQVYGYHDCAMEILTCVTELFAAGDKYTAAGDNSSRIPLFPPIDERRYRPPTPPQSELDPQAEESPLPWRQNSQEPPAKPSSLPSLDLSSDGGRRYHKRRRKRWANGSLPSASDADAEFSDATVSNFTQ